MCIAPKKPSPPPAPEPIPETPPTISNATTKKDAPKLAKSTSSTAQRKRRGRGSLRIPLITSGLSQSGINFPTP
jgi:hypothetical protein|tara:strand:+ start:649 stop:870 length:222 start_codon:yes stop_codon:yes gene_type:complete